MLKNSIFKLRSLHDRQQTRSATGRNNLGLVGSDTATAAHLPSLLYWLFHRGGVPFEEARQLCAAKRLLLDGKPITDERTLERQVPWVEMAAKDIKIVNDRGVPCDPIQRARHRSYAFMRLTKTMTLTPEEEDPRSIIHSLPFLDQTSTSSYHALTPAGFSSNMRGLIVVTNDAQLRPLWHNEFLGNWGRYDLRFHQGCPDEAVEMVRAECSKQLATQKYSKDIKVRPRAVIDHAIPMRGNDAIARMNSKPFRTDVRLIVETPLFDFRLWTFVRRHTATCALIRNGPFDTPLDTLTQPRRLTLEELEELFAFERRLKTNKIVYGLRTLQDDTHGGAGGDPLANLSSGGDGGVYGEDDDVFGASEDEEDEFGNSDIHA